MPPPGLGRHIRRGGNGVAADRASRHVSFWAEGRRFSGHPRRTVPQGERLPVKLRSPGALMPKRPVPPSGKLPGEVATTGTPFRQLTAAHHGRASESLPIQLLKELSRPFGKVRCISTELQTATSRGPCRRSGCSGPGRPRSRSPWGRCGVSPRSGLLPRAELTRGRKRLPGAATPPCPNLAPASCGR
jgi:hypothetical protein